MASSSCPPSVYPVDPPVQAILFTGIQATGKSSFYRERFFHSHVRINLDMLRTRHRERVLLRACLEALQPFVVDNTNLTRQERATYIDPARAAGFEVVGYYFQSKVEDSIVRNTGRPSAEQIPERGIRGSSARLQIPSLDEGFQRLFYVAIAPAGGFVVEEWRHEV